MAAHDVKDQDKETSLTSIIFPCEHKKCSFLKNLRPEGGALCVLSVETSENVDLCVLSPSVISRSSQPRGL